MNYNADSGARPDPELSEELPTDQEESTALTVKEAEQQTTSGTTEPEIEIAGVHNWNRPSGIAFGAATSLYERHPVSGETAGNPLADVSNTQFYHLNHSFITISRDRRSQS